MTTEFAKMEAQHARNMAKLEAEHYYDIGDLKSVYAPTSDPVFLPNTGWKRCPAPWSTLYVSFTGQVRGTKGYVLKLHTNNAGYAMVAVCDSGKTTTSTAHKMTALAWVKNDDPAHKRVVDHKDDNKLNNNADNLAWLTYSENLTKAHRMNQMAGKNSKNVGLKIIKVDADGTRTAYKSASAAGKDNGLSAVSVTGNAKGQLKLNKPYHFELAQK